MKTQTRPFRQTCALLQTPTAGTHFNQSSMGWRPHPQPGPAPLGSTQCLLSSSHLEMLPCSGQLALYFKSAVSLTSRQVNYLLLRPPSSLTSMKLSQIDTNAEGYSLSVNSMQSRTAGHNSPEVTTAVWRVSFKLS